MVQGNVSENYLNGSPETEIVITTMEAKKSCRDNFTRICTRAGMPFILLFARLAFDTAKRSYDVKRNH